MKNSIFETFPFGIIRLSPDNQILRANKKADSFLQRIKTSESSSFLQKFINESTSSWTDTNGQVLYIEHFKVEGSEDSLLIFGNELDFTNNVPDLFVQRIEDFPADPHGVINRIASLVRDAVTFERFDLLRIDPQLRKYTYEYSIGLNIEGTVRPAYSEIRETGLGWIFKNEVPHLVYDLSQTDLVFCKDPLLLQTGYKALLRVPIVFEHGVVGAILLASSEAGRFELEDAFLLYQLSKLMAQPFFNSGFLLEYEFHELTAATFMQTVISLVNETNLKDFLNVYCEKLRITSEMDHVSIFIFDKKEKQSFCLAETGRESLDSPDWSPIRNKGMIEMLHSQSIISFNLADPLFSDVKHLSGKGFTSIIYVPILEKGQIIGAMVAICSDERALTSFTAGLFKNFSEKLSLIFAKIPLKNLHSVAKDRKFNKTLHVGFKNIIGSSQIMQDTIHQAVLAAQYDFPILISGETGTGKELFAKAIHQTSQVAQGPFIVVNSAAIPENLLESELFGYQEGAFTGGLKGGKRGKILLADGGTLFLDEIGELSPELQAKLLRVIQEQEVEPLGSTKPIPVHVRIISATHRDLSQMIKEGTFREDLLYRLNAIEIQLPPLRKRGLDIIELSDHMLNQLSQSHGTAPKTFSSYARDLLLQYDWPGNVRQLQNIVNRLFVFVESATIQPQDLPPDFRSTSKSSDETERDRVERLLIEFGGNKTTLAHYLGITRTGLWKKLKRLKLQ